MPCEARLPRPDARADWCRRYLYHIDRGGRFCRWCATDDAFRRMLERRAALHRAALRGEVSETMRCPVFGVLTDAAECGACQADPRIRNFLYGQGQVGAPPSPDPV